MPRPTKYDKTYCTRLIEFFSLSPTDNNGKANEYPTFRDFSRSIGVTHKTVTGWKNKNPEFLLAFEECKALQVNFILKNALAGRFNSSFSAFVLKNIAGWRDSKDVNHSGEVTGNETKVIIVHNKEGQDKYEKESRVAEVVK